MTGATVPIGRPIANTQVYVLNNNREPVAIGESGELYIGGAGLARGYYGRPDLTSERFLQNPFGPPGSRLYRTGDLVRYRTDGNLEFVGRIDDQVKLHGQRVELGEIEAVLMDHPRVEQAIVLVREDETGHKRLVAYVVGADSQTLEASDLRSHLRRSCPDSIIPSAFVVMNELPLMPNGKVDRKALSTFVISTEARTEVSNDYMVPQTLVEKALSGFWEDVLMVDRFGIHDDFFELGGTSLDLMRVLARAGDHFGASLDPSVIAQGATIASLARSIEKELV